MAGSVERDAPARRVRATPGVPGQHVARGSRVVPPPSRVYASLTRRPHRETATTPTGRLVRQIPPYRAASQPLSEFVECADPKPSVNADFERIRDISTRHSRCPVISRRCAAMTVHETLPGRGHRRVTRRSWFANAPSVDHSAPQPSRETSVNDPAALTEGLADPVWQTRSGRKRGRCPRG